MTQPNDPTMTQPSNVPPSTESQTANGPSDPAITGGTVISPLDAAPNPAEAPATADGSSDSPPPGPSAPVLTGTAAADSGSTVPAPNPLPQGSADDGNLHPNDTNAPAPIDWGNLSQQTVANDRPSSTDAPPAVPSGSPPPAEQSSSSAPAGPQVGDWVVYHGDLGGARGEDRPALVVRVNDDRNLNLLVFLDGENDGIGRDTIWVPSSLEFDESDKDQEKARRWSERS